jgi:thiamine transporter
MAGTRTKVLVEVALTVGLSAVLHFLRVWQMPAGGTVSLEMLPVLVLALRRGPVAGMVAGALFGTLNLALEPYVVHWAQFVLDYPLAFGLVGLAGLFAPAWRSASRGGRLVSAARWLLPLSVAVGAFGRYLAHFTSGLIFFATADFGGPLANAASPFANTGALTAAAAYSAVYNLYVPLSAVGCLVALFAVMPVLERSIASGDAS